MIWKSHSNQIFLKLLDKSENILIVKLSVILTEKGCNEDSTKRHEFYLTEDIKHYKQRGIS